MLDAATELNDRQPERLLSLMDNHVDVENKRVAVLGPCVQPRYRRYAELQSNPRHPGTPSPWCRRRRLRPRRNREHARVYPDIEYADTPQQALDASAAPCCHGPARITNLSEEFDAMATPVVVDGHRAIDR